jgi:hypothetical protein
MVARATGEPMIDHLAVERVLTQLYLGGGAPRNEERKKAQEVAGLLEHLARVQPQPAPRGKLRLLVDAAAGNGYVGLCAAALLGWRRVVAIERDPDRAERVRSAARKLDFTLALEVVAAEMSEAVLPRNADVVLALHACGSASDAVLRAAIQVESRWILCAPCCYGAGIEDWAHIMAGAAVTLPDDAVLAARFASVQVDARRLAELRRAGYEASLRSFTAPTVTPHHLLFLARRGGR